MNKQLFDQPIAPGLTSCRVRPSLRRVSSVGQAMPSQTAATATKTYYFNSY